MPLTNTRHRTATDGITLRFDRESQRAGEEMRAAIQVFSLLFLEFTNIRVEVDGQTDG
jgi:hypothetical protein